MGLLLNLDLAILVKVRLLDLLVSVARTSQGPRPLLMQSLGLLIGGTTVAFRPTKTSLETIFGGSVWS